MNYNQIKLIEIALLKSDGVYSDYVNGCKVSFNVKNHYLHRDDGPAVEWDYGAKEWWINGNPHREDGPAFVGVNEFENQWWFNGRLHRLDGPAIKDNYEEKWFKEGKLHREDGPAIEYANGEKLWYQNGKIHRLDGPAVEYYGHKEWWQNGKLHRIDGPACEYSNGTKWWSYQGEEINCQSQEEYERIIRLKCLW